MLVMPSVIVEQEYLVNMETLELEHSLLLLSVLLKMMVSSNKISENLKIVYCLFRRQFMV